MKQTPQETEWLAAADHAPAAPKTLPAEVSLAQPSPAGDRPSSPRSSVSLRPSGLWSHALLWGLIGILSTTVVWACLAQFEEAVQTQGQLKPQGAVKEVQAPIAGVVKGVYVKDGQRVKRGDRLLSLDATAARAELTSLHKIRTSLLLENRFYQQQLAGSNPPAAVPLSLPPAIAALTKSRRALLAEQQTYRAQLQNSTQGLELSVDQAAQVEAAWGELSSRQQAAALERNQVERQFEQAQIQWDNAKVTAAIQQRVLSDMAPLVQRGAIARTQYLNQVQEVSRARSEVNRLAQEQARLHYAIAQSQEQQQTLSAQFEREVRRSLAENEKGMAEIDSQLNKAIVDNEKRIAEIDNQISQAKLSLTYQVLVAPADGTIFDLQARAPGFVTQTSQPLLKVVPQDALTAEVFITNQDIGFIKPGMAVDIRIDSFPYSEFGDVKGTLVWIGSDALPPTETRPFYSFPARVKLDRQSLSIKGRDVLLQSGMSLQANIKVRKRSVISIFTELFINQVDDLQSVR
jgi:hemolysin D